MAGYLQDVADVVDVLWEQFGKRGKARFPEALAIKDPRLCRLVPLYAAALAECGAAPRYVITLRDPWVCAESLYRRDGLPRRVGLELWVGHMLGALSVASGADSALVRYDELLRHPDEVCAALARWLVGPEEVSSTLVQTMRRSVAPELNHSAGLGRVPEIGDDWITRLACEMFDTLASQDLERVLGEFAAGWSEEFEERSVQCGWMSFDRVVVAHDSLSPMLQRHAEGRAGILLVRDGEESVSACSSSALSGEGVGVLYNLVDRGEAASLVRGASLCAGKPALLVLEGRKEYAAALVDWFLRWSGVGEIVRLLSADRELIAVGVPGDVQLGIDFWKYINSGDEPLQRMLLDCSEKRDLVLENDCENGPDWLARAGAR
ncbi:hypothetical protein IAI53_00260 [Thauera sp. CAU 1555]|uniref:Sulfotransferase n=1 Tax=Thauera sedimentorum TaxID=2767595 RepID=A0ABR9B4N4_9RHOO|nr:hypothetical protein [Thauera sedimentorum]MBC9070395.1 hypothetical protein [Thauera sedimentorum]MBD8501315.1 hypothetical protein [Thauera sedimentorum]